MDIKHKGIIMTCRIHDCGLESHHRDTANIHLVSRNTKPHIWEFELDEFFCPAEEENDDCSPEWEFKLLGT